MKRRWLIPLGALAAMAFPATAAAHAGGAAVFTLSNQTSGSRVLVFARGHDGTLSPAGSVSTGGDGTGVAATTQGSLALSPDGRRLYAVNGGSGTIAIFAVHGTHLTRLAVVPSGGAGPASLTAGHGRVYVVNAGGLNVVGFRVTGGGLRRIHHGYRRARLRRRRAGAGLAQPGRHRPRRDEHHVEHDRHRHAAAQRRHPAPALLRVDGHDPVRIRVHPQRRAGRLGRPPGADERSELVPIGHTGALELLSGPVAANQLAACWVAINGRIAYTANAGSGTISAFRIGSDGRLHLRGVVASPGSTSKPLDESVTPGGGYLDVLTSGLNSITSYRIGHHGTLVPIGSVGGLPVGDVSVASS